MPNNCVLASPVVDPEVRMVARIVGNDKRAENLLTFDIFINSGFQSYTNLVWNVRVCAKID
jgi:hypothetical protein